MEKGTVFPGRDSSQLPQSHLFPAAGRVGLKLGQHQLSSKLRPNNSSGKVCVTLQENSHL